MASYSTQTGGLQLRMSLDLTEFNKAMDEYMKWQKRLPADVINTKLAYIARNATMTTKAADKSGIESSLRGPARDYPDAPLAAIIINSKLGNQGKKGLTGAAMAKAVEKLIRKRKSAVNFVRAGWKNAIRLLEEYMKSRGEYNNYRRWGTMAPVDKETMKKRKFEKLGKAIVARIEQSPKAWGEIQNNVSGGDNPHSNFANLEQVKLQGLQKAVNKEVASMYIYLERKMNPVHREFNKKQGF